MTGGKRGADQPVFMGGGASQQVWQQVASKVLISHFLGVGSSHQFWRQVASKVQISQFLWEGRTITEGLATSGKKGADQPFWGVGSSHQFWRHVASKVQISRFGDRVITSVLATSGKQGADQPVLRDWGVGSSQQVCCLLIFVAH